MIRQIFVFIFAIYGSLFSEHTFSKIDQLKNCFERCWGVDPATATYLCQYFAPFSDSDLIENFIAQSIDLDIQFPLQKQLVCLSPDDGVIQATKFHFDSHIRCTCA